MSDHAPLSVPVPRWRQEPYRLLFPEALLMAWAGVGGWLLYALGVSSGRLSDYHAVAQVEGFISCIAAGFLFTFLPRRAGSAPAGPVQVAAAIATPVVTVVALLVSARIDRPPTVPGVHRRVIWLSAWLLPAGYALAALSSRYEEAGLHIVYVGGFALMALSVGYHVAQAHGGTPGVLTGRPLPFIAMAVLLVLAVALRALVDLERAHEHLWLGAAAAAFLAATACWAALVLPRLRAG